MESVNQQEAGEKILMNEIPNTVAVYNYFTSGRKAKPGMPDTTIADAPSVANSRNERVTHIGTLIDGTGFATIDPDGLGRLYDGSPPKGWPVDLQGSGSENNS